MFKRLIKGFDTLLGFLLLGLIILYRKIYSRFSMPRCRFYPSCSMYSMQAIKKYGFFCGIPRSLWRIIRCNPFNDGGYDPVK